MESRNLRRVRRTPRKGCCQQESNSQAARQVSAGKLFNGRRDGPPIGGVCVKAIFGYLALLVLLAACAGNTTTDANGTAQDDVPAGDGGDAEDEFNAFFSKRNMEWRIAYDLKSTYDGQTSTSQMTQYVDGEDRFRTDMMFEGTEARSYMVDETFITCTKQGAEWSCFKMTSDGGNETADTREWEEEYEEDATKYEITSDGTKVVAGVTAKCFKITEAGNVATTVRYCFSPDGAPLYIYSSGDGGVSEMIATSYSKSVSDSDFTPPAEARDISAMYGGAGGTLPADGDGGDMCAYCDYLSGDDKAECLANC